MPVFPTFDFVSCIPFLKNMNMAIDPTTEVIERLDWITLSKHGKGELFSPSLEPVNIIDEVAHMREVLERENYKFQENLAAEISHAYLTFFCYISRLILAHFYLLYFRHLS